jgi:hypothetical protein
VVAALFWAGAKAAAEPIRAAMMADFMLEMYSKEYYESILGMSSAVCCGG